jgi:YbbR domain-containing protein
VDFLRRYVFANFGYKIISLVFAIALWWVISHGATAVVGLTVPIEFRHIPANLEISSLNIPEAQVRVRGPERTIHSLRPQDVHVEVDLRDVKPGERTFDMTDQQVKLPEDLKVMQVVPAQLRLSFDQTATRTVEVRPRVIGTFAPGYQISQVLADPAAITVSGPRMRVDQVEAATTDPVDVSGNMGRNTFVTNAYVADPLVQLVHPTPIHVTVIMERATAALPSKAGPEPAAKN